MEKQNIHANHRQRLFETVKQVGFDKLNDINALEFVLTFVIPRKDVNPLAHALLDKFGGFAKVFDADITELIQVDGMGERSATQLKMFLEIFRRYQVDKQGKSPKIVTIGDMVNFLKPRLAGKDKEEFIIVGLSANYNVVSVKTLAVGVRSNVALDPKDINMFILNKQIQGIIIAHNHPNASASPSRADVEATEKVKQLCKVNNVVLFDHLIFGEDDIYSLNRLEYIEEADIRG